MLTLHANATIGIRSCTADRIMLSSGEERQQSFLLSAESAVQSWALRDARAMVESDLAAVFALQPDVFLLGTGPRQVFPNAAILAACLKRRIGLEVMDNAAAARTFNVLSSEGRKVLLGMLLPG